MTSAAAKKTALRAIDCFTTDDRGFWFYVGATGRKLGVSTKSMTESEALRFLRSAL